MGPLATTLLIIAIVVVVVVIVLFILGKKAQKKQAEQQEMMEANKQTISMLIIGFRLTELKLKRAFRDKFLYLNIAVSLFVVPVAVFVLVKLVSMLGIYHDELTASVLMISASAPAAAATSMFAEKFDGDSVYAGLIVSITSILCVITMPIVCALTQLY